MKEKETGPNPVELTIKAVNPTLEVRGDFIMPEGSNGGPEQPRPKERESRPKRDTSEEGIRKVRAAWDAVHPIANDTSSDERTTIETAIRMGIAPMAGGAGGGPDDEGEGAPEGNPPDAPIDLDAKRQEAARKLREEAREQFKKGLVEQIRTGQLSETEASEAYAEVLGTEEFQIDQALKQVNAEKKSFGQIVSEASERIQQVTEERQAQYYFRHLLSAARQITEEVDQGNFELKPGMREWFERAKATVVTIDKGGVNVEDFGVSEYQATAAILTEGGHLKTLSERFEAERRDRKNITQPESLEDLIGLIEHSELPKWRRGGDMALTEQESDEGEVKINMNNFLAWVRDKIMYNHDFNPDGNIDLFSNIYIPTPYRQIGLGEIIATPRYFRKEVKNGEPKNNEQYENFRDHLLYEVWLFQNSHNFDVKYRLSSQGNEEKAIEALMEIHALNIFTKNKDRLLNILTLPSLDQEQVANILEGKERTEAGVGQAIRQSILAYNYLYEINGVLGPDGEARADNMFEMELGEEGTLEFYKATLTKLIKDRFGEAFGAQIKEIDDRNKGKKFSDREDVLEKLMEREDFLSALQDGYDQDPQLGRDLAAAITLYRNIGENDPHRVKKQAEQLKNALGHLLKKTHSNSGENAKGVEDLNIFGAFSRQPYMQDLVREGIRHAVGREQNLTDLDFKYAENWAFSMAYWTGIAAKGDVNAYGMDGLSKLIHFKDYRMRQAEGRGVYGDLETMFGINKMALTMWEALRVRDEKTGVEKTLLEALQGGRGSKTDISSAISAFSFSEGSQEVVLTAQHYPNILGLYKLLMTEHGMNFDQILTRDNLGRMIINHKEADKIRKEWIKYLRYGFDMPGFYYEREVRGAYRVFNPTKGTTELRVDNMPLAELMFGKKVREMGMFDLHDSDRLVNKTGVPKSLYEHFYRERRDENGNYLDANGNIVTDKARAELVLKGMSRNLFAYFVATELWRHRNYFSTNTRYSLETFDTIEQYLRMLPLEVAGDEDTGLHVSQGYFGSKEFRRIRHEGKVDPNRLELENLGLSGASSVYGALLEMLKVLGKETARVA